jgi:hypothetical protein
MTLKLEGKIYSFWVVEIKKKKKNKKQKKKIN